MQQIRSWAPTYPATLPYNNACHPRVSVVLVILASSFSCWRAVGASIVHTAARVISMGSALTGLKCAVDLNRQSDTFNTPYVKAIYQLHFTAKPTTPGETAEAYRSVMSSLPLSAQVAVGATGCGLISGPATVGYGTTGFTYHTISLLATGNPTHKRSMLRSLTTAGCGVVASSISCIALFSILEGIKKTMETHNFVLSPVRDVRKKLKK